MNVAGERTSLPARGEVAEFQGLYGSYHVSEVLLQKIWLRGAFDLSRARTTAGEPVTVLHPGSWDRLSGPDFRGAKLRIGDRVVIGDVEVHFRVEGWTAHGHDRDPAYDGVVLHVVLFPPVEGASPGRTSAGRELPVLPLIELLWHDLEEYAADEAVTALSGRDPWPVVERLLGLPASERRRELADAEERRWKEKVHFARLRIERLGWEEACHQTALEVLGYRANRVAMLRVGCTFPWRSWIVRAPEIDELVAAADEAWTLRGARPANHPWRRLEQYRAWMGKVPDWPRQLRDWRLPEVTGDIGMEFGTPARIRRRLEMSEVRDAMDRGLFGKAVAGTRRDTLIINLALPFLAVARSAEPARVHWRHWYVGDTPDNLVEAARQLRSPGERAVMANGLLQGLLELQLEQLRSERPG